MSSQPDVLILGAGFSRAICERMPLTDELGNLVVEACGLSDHARVPDAGFEGGYFETWLSRLAEPQPHLRSFENTANRALFGQIADGIATILDERQREVLGQDGPPWLYDLLSVLHVRRAAVLTMNYDNLVEAAVDGHHLWDHRGNARVTTQDILNGIPQLAQPTFASMGGRVHQTFSLLKLHGSLQWYWSPDDESGSTLQRWDTPGVFGAPVPVDETLRTRLMPGREPFLVPPASSKSSYYRNLVTRELWRRAFDALVDASTIYLMGYSLPDTDTTFSGMIRDAVQGRDVEFVIADINADQVAERLVRLGAEPTRVRCVGGDRPVAQVVNEFTEIQARTVVDQLKAHRHVDGSPLGSLIVSWGNEETLSPRLVHTVTRVQVDDERSELVLTLHDGSQGPSVLAPQPSQLSELIDALGSCERLVADTGTRRLPIIDLWTSPQPAGDGYRWISLVPAGRLPS